MSENVGDFRADVRGLQNAEREPDRLVIASEPPTRAVFLLTKATPQHRTS